MINVNAKYKFEAVYINTVYAKYSTQRKSVGTIAVFSLYYCILGQFLTMV